MSIKIWRVEHGKSKDHKQVTDDDTEQRGRELLLLVDILPLEGGDLSALFLGAHARTGSYAEAFYKSS